jgi:signal transduction histidine kinase
MARWNCKSACRPVYSRTRVELDVHAEPATESDLPALRLLEDGNLLRLEIADNGRSFHPDRATAAQKNGRLGLVGLRERAEMLGRTLEIHAEQGNGTTVRAAVPVRG